jgi:hypothetical protein
MIGRPGSDAKWHQNCSFFKWALEGKTTSLDIQILMQMVGNPINSCVLFENWSNLSY